VTSITDVSLIPQWLTSRQAAKAGFIPNLRCVTFRDYESYRLSVVLELKAALLFWHKLSNVLKSWVFGKTHTIHLCCQQDDQKFNHLDVMTQVPFCMLFVHSFLFLKQQFLLLFQFIKMIQHIFVTPSTNPATSVQPPDFNVTAFQKRCYAILKLPLPKKYFSKTFNHSGHRRIGSIRSRPF
jgi:hypothetical protein